MDMIGKVRRLHRRDKKSVHEIARLTGLSRNTVDKWLQAPLDGAPKYRRAPQPSKLTAQRVATVLQAATPPLADMARYDRLRAQASAEEVGHA